MLRARFIPFVVASFVVLAWIPGSAAGANKEHLQMMADIRMLQEQTQLLQAQLTALTDVLKVISTKLDDQSNASRKAFADQKLLSDTLSNDLRVVREKVDDNNVRISSLSQELEAMRSVAATGAAPGFGASPATDQPGAPAASASGTPPAAVPSAVAGMSPQRVYDMAWADYAAAQYDLAISGFEGYIRSYGKTDLAGEALYFIGESFYQQGKFRDAVTAYDRGISEYPNNKKVPDMYFKRGMAQSALGQTDRARESWEYVVKTFPNSDTGRLAKQRLEQLSRRDE